MNLSELRTGEEGVVLKIRGRGAFRRRIMEMGFVRGNCIRVIKNAPFKDPIEYGLLDYRVSLRRSEAELIEVGFKNKHKQFKTASNGSFNDISERKFQTTVGNSINVAFVGNPNAGKTSIFNFASRSNEQTGNYSGVTVDSKTARFTSDGFLYNITDLPGTYSISAYSPEEIYVREYIIDKVPDVIVNVIDASNLERNLYLTTQLIDMDVRIVLALNMYDELGKSSSALDFVQLGKLLGIPIVPTVGSKGRGINELLQKIANVNHDRDPNLRHIHINYGAEIETSINKIQTLLKIPENYIITDRISSRFIAIKLLEKDRHIEDYIHNAKNYTDIIGIAKKECARLELLHGEDTSSLLTSKRYGFIGGALLETLHKGEQKEMPTSDILDGFLTHRVFGFPFFIFFMWIMFTATFKLGAFPQSWIENGIGFLGSWLHTSMPEGSLKDLLIDGIIGGVGGVIVFLPNILILFLFISFMEDSGYMARAVFIMDKLMHKIGLHGKSFIPLIMGFGCNVPAIMATRTIEDRNNRLLTMLINPFMSCSARLPVYLLLIGAIFPKFQGTFLFLLYAIGVLLAILAALFFKRFIFKTQGTPFVMELPPYRMPTMRSTLKHMWQKGSQYLKKMGGVILIASILIWALGYFPRDNMQVAKNSVGIQGSGQLTDDLLKKQTEIMRLEHSYIGRLGKKIEPVIRPLGFDWKMGVSLISGITAKEIVISTLGVLLQSEENSSNSEDNLPEKIQNERYSSGSKKGEKVFTPLATISFLLFILIYFPCVAVFAAIKKESGSIWWALLMIFYTTALAYLVSFIVYQVGSIFIQ